MLRNSRPGWPSFKLKIPFVDKDYRNYSQQHVQKKTNGAEINAIERASRARERGQGARRKTETEVERPPIRSRKPMVKNVNAHKNTHFVDKGRKVQIQLSDTCTIPGKIFGNATPCLIDTGAYINLINYEWLTTKVDKNSYNMGPAEIESAGVANGDTMPIKGFVTLPISINNHTFDEIPFYVVQGLSQSIILGLEFLNKHDANIDCAKRTVTLNKVSQLRVIEKQEIPPHSQSIIGVKCSNNLPINLTGLCQGGRHITSLGIMVANSVSVVPR